MNGAANKRQTLIDSLKQPAENRLQQ